MNRIRWYGPTLVLLLTVLVTMVAGPGLVREIVWAGTDARITQIKSELSHNPTLAELSEAFRKVAVAVEPSVVHVAVASRRPASSMRDFFDLEERLEEFFDMQIPGREREERGEGERDPYGQYDPARPRGNGSGWVYDDNGHIITNYHVVKGADEITVKFSNGSEYEAEVVGYDEQTDVAVLRVDAPNLHPATTAQRDVEPGDIVFAFGSPFGFSFSMSQGIVSAKGRRIGIIGPNGYENFLQTDAAINPGNSGGPLTNIYGEVIGMNTAIATPGGGFRSLAGGFVGIGFAIPIDMVADVADKLITTGRVSRGYLGILLPESDLDPALAKTFGFEGEGVLVKMPQPGGPADKAGVKRGDIITHIDGKEVTSIAQLRRMVASMPPGQEVELTVFRNGQTVELTVTLAEFPSSGQLARGGSRPQLDDESAKAMETLRKYGIEDVADFTEAMAERLGVEFQPGVLVTSVRRGSLAYGSPEAGLGIRRGMIITEVMDEPVSSVEELATEIEKHDAAEGIRISVSVWDRANREWIPDYELIQIPENGQ